jgi:hypothetical protein
VALRMFGDDSRVRDDAFLLPVAAALEEHLEFVEAHLEDEGAVPNNHLLANAVGLWVVSALFPALPGASPRRARAGRILSKRVRTQVNADGTSFENSIGYHLWVTELLTLAFVAAGEEASAPFSQRLKAMFFWPLSYCSQSGLAPQLGDNDSSRALPFCDRPSAYHGHLPSVGAALFNEEEFKREGDVLADEAVWLLGAAGLERWESLAPRAKEASRVSEAGGWAVLRSAPTVVTASIGGNGQRGVGGHSHRDKLSFELHHRGIRLIADPGSPSYGRDRALRRAYRSTLVHNALALDGEEMAPLLVERPFSLPAELRAGVEHFSDTAETAELCASHSGYRRLAAPAVVRRRWVLGKKEKFLSICDWVVGVGTHEARVALMIPGREASMRNPSAKELERASEAVASEVCWAGAAAQVSNSAVILFTEPFAVSMVQTQYSPGYGELASAQEVRADARVKGPARLQWIVLFID